MEKCNVVKGRERTLKMLASAGLSASLDVANDGITCFDGRQRGHEILGLMDIFA
jgi:hypothetical protein